jgi:hypothetical protein
MNAADVVGAVEIGERARHPQHAVIAARGKSHGVGGVAQQRKAGGAGPRDLFQHGALRMRGAKRMRPSAPKPIQPSTATVTPSAALRPHGSR